MSIDVLGNSVPDVGNDLPFTPAIFFIPPRSVREKLVAESEDTKENGIGMYYGSPEINSVLSFLRSHATVAKVPAVEAVCADAAGGDGVDGATNSTNGADEPPRDSASASDASSAITSGGAGSMSHSEL